MLQTTTSTLQGRDIDYEVVGQQGGMMMVSVSGTAVRYR